MALAQVVSCAVQSTVNQICQMHIWYMLRHVVSYYLGYVRFKQNVFSKSNTNCTWLHQLLSSSMFFLLWNGLACITVFRLEFVTKSLLSSGEGSRQPAINFSFQLAFTRTNRVVSGLHFRRINKFKLAGKVRGDRRQLLHTCHCNPNECAVSTNEFSAPAAWTMPIKLPFQTGSWEHPNCAVDAIQVLQTMDSKHFETITDYNSYA